MGSTNSTKCQTSKPLSDFDADQFETHSKDSLERYISKFSTLLEYKYDGEIGTDKQTNRVFIQLQKPNKKIVWFKNGKEV